MTSAVARAQLTGELSMLQQRRDEKTAAYANVRDGQTRGEYEKKEMHSCVFGQVGVINSSCGR